MAKHTSRTDKSGRFQAGVVPMPACEHPTRRLRAPKRLRLRSGPHPFAASTALAGWMMAESIGVPPTAHAADYIAADQAQFNQALGTATSSGVGNSIIYGVGGTLQALPETIAPGSSPSLAIILDSTNFNIGSGSAFTLNANSSLTLNGGQLGLNAGTLNLSGGTLSVGGPNGIAGTGQFNFGNGVLAVGAGGLTTTTAAALVRGATSAIGVSDGDVAVWSGILSDSAGSGTGGGLRKIGGGTLTLGAVNTYTGATTIDLGTLKAGVNNAIADSASLTVRSGATFDMSGNAQSIKNLSLAGGIVDIGAQRLEVNDTGATIWSGAALSPGGGVIAKQGEGTVTLSNFDMGAGGLYGLKGGFAVADGISTIKYLVVGSGTGFGAPGPNIASMSITGGSLNIAGAGAGTALQIGDFGGHGTVTQAGGTVTVSSGASLNIGNQGGTGIYSISAGLLDVSGGLNVVGRSTGANASTGTINITGGELLLRNDARLVLGNNTGANLLGSGTINQTGGTLRVEDTSSLGLSAFSNGYYNLSGGTLEIGGSSLRHRYAGNGRSSFNIGDATVQVIDSALTTDADATLVSGTISTIDTNGLGATWSGALSGAGTLNKTGLGTLRLTGPNSYGGGTILNAGALSAGSAGAFGTGTISVAGDAAIALASNIVVANRIEIASGTTVSLDSGINNIGFSGVIAGAGHVEKIGTGTTHLSGQSTYGGTTTVSAGGLVADIADALPAGTALSVGPGASFALGGFDQTVGSLAGAGTVHLGTNLLALGGDSSSTVFAGAFTDTGSFRKQGAGTFTLSGTSAIGPSTVAGGVLLVDGDLAGSLAVESSATLGGTGNVGSVVVGAGGALSAGGGSTPVGTLTIDGDLTTGNGSILNYDLATPNGGGSPNDLVQVNGNLALNGGTVNVATTAPGFLPGSYTLISYTGTLSGSAAAMSLGTMPDGFGLSQIQTAVDQKVNLIALNAVSTQWWKTTGTPFGGSGDWNNANANWADSSGASPQGWVSGGMAIFDGMAGTATLDAPISASALQFKAAGYEVSGGNALTLVGAPGSPAPYVMVDTGVTATISAGIAGMAGLTKVEAGTLILSGSNTYTGGTFLDGGMVQVAADANLGDASGGLAFDGGRLATTASFSSARTLTFDASGATIDTAAGTTLALSGAAGGDGGLTKQGAGTLAVSGASSYSGATGIAQGTLQAGAANVLSSASAYGLASEASLALNGYDQAIGSLSGAGNLTTDGTGGSGTLTAGLDNLSTLFSGVISGGGSFIKAGSGTMTLGGANTYTGGTLITAGVLTLAPGGSFAPTSAPFTVTGGMLDLAGSQLTTGAFTLNEGTVANGTLMASSYQFQSGAISATLMGAAGVNMTGPGTVSLTGTNTYSGGTSLTGGTLSIGGDGALGSGGLTLDGGGLQAGAPNITLPTPIALSGPGGFDNNGTIFIIAGTIAGAGGLTSSGSGTTQLNGANGGFSGAVTIASGTLQGAAAAFGLGNAIANNGALVFAEPSAQLAQAVYGGAISGSGTLALQGGGNLNLTGISALSGPTTIAAGTLSVNGSLANSTVTVLNGARLGGNGTVGGLVVANAGTLAPGNSIGALTIAGPASFAPGSVYSVEVNAAGQSDRVTATGPATLGGATVSVLAEAGDYQAQTNYTILSASGGISGQFGTVFTNLAFLTPRLSYDPANVYLTLARNDRPFSAAALTPNQAGVAEAVQALGLGNPVYREVLFSSAPQARAGFDLLSGEIHAAAIPTLYSEATMMREAVFGRLRSLSFQGPAPAGTATTGVRPLASPANGFGVWGQGFGGWGNSRSNAGTASVDRSAGGFVLGGDATVGNGLRVGAAGGYVASSFDVDARLSQGSTQSVFGALYAGANFGAFSLSGGALYAGSQVSTNRAINVASVSDHATAKYDASTVQAFAEGAYRIPIGANMGIEPFVNAAAIRISTDAFTESGGLAALAASARDYDIAMTTIGLRLDARLPDFGIGGVGSPILRATLAWRGAFGDVDQGALLAFRESPTLSRFAVESVPVDRSALVAGLGLDWQLGTDSLIGVSYSGQFGRLVQEQEFKGRFELRF
ncbi:autotransporter domain-containing protein [Bosea caraganae]|uniref:Autotransporter domain-containing protein n=1 Tax=Bosea caraganae TaxID=2763117 RepID=A0A370LA02_9HYPH|nr:autotransporter domain-containing protein [Bosea caraganae]RDJ21919.1 autotransporter domain-containing protein [Bosea caraganae]RDJ28049.1 autotransporter domain-containing protein [Bosea caraganae]